MKRCSAPCVGHITKNQYAEDLIGAKNYLTSSDSQTIKRLEREIELFSNSWLDVNVRQERLVDELVLDDLSEGYTFALLY